VTTRLHKAEVPGHCPVLIKHIAFLDVEAESGKEEHNRTGSRSDVMGDTCRMKKQV
jgi:hypothetical protein